MKDVIQSDSSTLVEDIQPEEVIFVFGSNTQGRHGKGAAKVALDRFGAINGQARELQGNSYGIITKELRGNYKKITLQEVEANVEIFLPCAYEEYEQQFYITRIGCGLAGFKDSEIAPLFKGTSDNCIFPIEWKEWLGTNRRYYGKPI